MLDNMLAAKFQAEKFPVASFFPEVLFSGCLVFAERAGEREDLFVFHYCFLTSPPAPWPLLLLGRRGGRLRGIEILGLGALVRSVLAPGSALAQLGRTRGQVFKDLVRELAMVEEDHPSSKEDEQQVGEDRGVALVPHFEGTLVGGDVGFVKFIRFHSGFGDEFFLVAEDDGADAGDAGLLFVYFITDIFGVSVEDTVDEGAGADDAHFAGKNVEDLRQLVDLGLAEEAAQGHQTGVVAQGNIAGADIRAVLEHGGELPDKKMLVFVADALLPVPHFPFAGEPQQGDEDDEYRGDEDEGYQSDEKVEGAFEQGVHK